MCVRREFNMPRSLDDIDAEARKRDEEYRKLFESSFIDEEEKGDCKEDDIDVITKLRTDIREIVCGLDDAFILEELLGYARHLIRHYVNGEELEGYEGLVYEVVEPEVGGEKSNEEGK